MNKREFRDEFFKISDEYFEGNETPKRTMDTLDSLMRLSWKLVSSIKNSEPLEKEY